MMLKKTIATAGTAGLLTAGSFGMAAPAQAAPLFTGGLVNVTITDINVEDNEVLSRNTTQVGVAAALALAANVCDVNVNVLARQFRNGGATCSNTVDGVRSTVTF